jgi:hypothetical protein
MEGMECLSLTEDDLDDDPMLSYTSPQLHHHETAEALLVNPPPEGAERQIWSRRHQNKLFHIDTIYYAGLEAQAQAISNPPPAQEEHLVLLVFMDTRQPVPASTTRGQPLIWIITIGDIMPFHILISSNAMVRLMSL